MTSDTAIGWQLYTNTCEQMVFCFAARAYSFWHSYRTKGHLAMPVVRPANRRMATLGAYMGYNSLDDHMEYWPTANWGSCSRQCMINPPTASPACKHDSPHDITRTLTVVTLLTARHVILFSSRHIVYLTLSLVNIIPFEKSIFVLKDYVVHIAFYEVVQWHILSHLTGFQSVICFQRRHRKFCVWKVHPQNFNNSIY